MAEASPRFRRLLVMMNIFEPLMTQWVAVAHGVFIIFVVLIPATYRASRTPR
jgi:hypothetical protein